MKLCSKCDKVKPLTSFYPSHLTRKTLLCKECRSRLRKKRTSKSTMMHMAKYKDELTANQAVSRPNTTSESEMISQFLTNKEKQ